MENVDKSVVLDAALLIKSYCKDTSCNQCIFWEKTNKWCKLETKKDYNFNTVPRDWKI